MEGMTPEEELNWRTKRISVWLILVQKVWTNSQLIYVLEIQTLHITGQYMQNSNITLKGSIIWKSSLDSVKLNALKTLLLLLSWIFHAMQNSLLLMLLPLYELLLYCIMKMSLTYLFILHLYLYQIL